MTEFFGDFEPTVPHSYEEPLVPLRDEDITIRTSIDGRYKVFNARAYYYGSEYSCTHTVSLEVLRFSLNNDLDNWVRDRMRSEIKNYILQHPPERLQNLDYRVVRSMREMMITPRIDEFDEPEPEEKVDWIREGF